MLSKKLLNQPENHYPLKVLGEKCILKQQEEVKKADQIFDSEKTNFPSFPSSWLSHAKIYVDIILSRFNFSRRSQVIRTASNDGYRLHNFKEYGPVFDIDPKTHNTSVAEKKVVRLKNLNKTERLHSFDSLRAIMMLLGLVLHSAGPYIYREYSEIKDPRSTNYTIDYLVDLIHSFRMPIFFVVAGFFGALLFYERSPLKMIKNRTSRIVYPFIVFLFILWPFFTFTYDYTLLIFSGSADAFRIALSKISYGTLIPQNTMHLWFLYYLLYFSLASFCLGLICKQLPSFLSRSLNQLFNWIIKKPILRILVFAGITCIVFVFTGNTSIYYSPSFWPHLFIFVQYFIFYIFGWFLLLNKHLLTAPMHFDWICTILGFIVFVIQILIPDHFIMSKSHAFYLDTILSSIIVWLFIFGITGLFIHYGNKNSVRMRYISDSSFWVYLIHLPFTILIPGFICEWTLSAYLKFLFVLIITTTVSFITYHYLVRPTFIGNFLNGRKYPLK